MTITTEVTIHSYCRTLDAMAKRMRDKGWFQVKFPRFLTTIPRLIAFGINNGDVLEIGPGPGYLGLELLKSTSNTSLTGLDISTDMIKIAKCNAAEYEFTGRARYHLGDASNMPFRDGQFDCVFSNASLHEWDNPRQVLNEIARVLRPGGRYYIADLRRDMRKFLKWIVWFMAWPREVRPYFIASIKDSYTIGEVKDILCDTQLRKSKIHKIWNGLAVIGRK